MNCYAGAW